MIAYWIDDLRASAGDVGGSRRGRVPTWRRCGGRRDRANGGRSATVGLARFLLRRLRPGAPDAPARLDPGLLDRPAAARRSRSHDSRPVRERGAGGGPERSTRGRRSRPGPLRELAPSFVRGDWGTSACCVGRCDPRARPARQLAAARRVRARAGGPGLGRARHARGASPGTSMLDAGVSATAVSLLAMPEFVVGTILSIVFAVELGWFPVSAMFRTACRPSLRAHAPSSGTALASSARSRALRAATLAVDADYTRTATAKGVAQRPPRHVLPNVLPTTLARSARTSATSSAASSSWRRCSHIRGSASCSSTRLRRTTSTCSACAPRDGGRRHGRELVATSPLSARPAPPPSPVLMATEPWQPGVATTGGRPAAGAPGSCVAEAAVVDGANAAPLAGVSRGRRRAVVLGLRRGCLAPLVPYDPQAVSPDRRSSRRQASTGSARTISAGTCSPASSPERPRS